MKIKPKWLPGGKLLPKDLEGPDGLTDNDVTVYTDLLIVGDQDGKPFSTHGDSGSLIVTNDDEHRPVGLPWRGWQWKLPRLAQRVEVVRAKSQANRVTP